MKNYSSLYDSPRVFSLDVVGRKYVKLKDTQTFFFDGEILCNVIASYNIKNGCNLIPGFKSGKTVRKLSEMSFGCMSSYKYDIARAMWSTRWVSISTDDIILFAEISE